MTGFRDIPPVSELLEHPALRQLAQQVGRGVVVGHVRRCLDEIRQAVREADGAAPVTVPDGGRLAQRIADEIRAHDRPRLRPVINATGILLHTGLGRAPLADEALDAMFEVGRDYASVEVDLATGRRSQRVLAVEGLIAELSGAEAAVVVNNNAGATLLALTALAAGGEVIVSRGQLVEVGGSFRLPDVMAASGAVLREVGTTNKTRIGDYRAAIGPQTAALMRVHTSNYVVVGFTAQPTLDELVALGREHGLPVIDDIGSGAMVDFSRYGFSDEPLAADSIRQGADVVLFSGDKLLGGPQCGIVAGRREVIARLANHPMMRALRVDKLTLAALAATLRLYRDPQRAERRVPLLRLLATPADELRDRAARMAAALSSSGLVSAAAVEDVAYLGGGSIPGQQLPTWCVSLDVSGGGVDALAAALRGGDPSVMGRVRQGRLLLDLRGVMPRQDEALLAAVRTAVSRFPGPTSDAP